MIDLHIYILHNIIIIIAHFLKTGAMELKCALIMSIVCLIDDLIA